jgi:hypothetical protein
VCADYVICPLTESLAGGHVVAMLVEALFCKSEGYAFDSRCLWIFSFDLILPAAL